MFYWTQGHTATASVTCYLAAKQSYVLQKLDVKVLVAVEVREKIALSHHRHLQARHAHIDILGTYGTPPGTTGTSRSPT